MGGLHLDLVGQRFGKLLVLKRAESKNGRAQWFCKCDCGNTTIVSTRELRTSVTRSCGCYHKELASKRLRKHGKTNTRLFKIWSDIKFRCTNKKALEYKYYGGRGIIICDEWEKDFLNFYNWAILNGYEENLTIDRIDVNGNYEPSNCRWVNLKTQNNNKRINRYITYQGKTQTLAQWCEELDLNYERIRARSVDKTPEELFFGGCLNKKMITYRGKTQCISEWSKEFGLNPATVERRIKKHPELSFEEWFKPARSWTKRN